MTDGRGDQTPPDPRGASSDAPGARDEGGLPPPPSPAAPPPPPAPRGVQLSPPDDWLMLSAADPRPGGVPLRRDETEAAPPAHAEPAAPPEAPRETYRLRFVRPRERKRKSFLRRAAVFVLQAALVFVVGSLLWVGAYRFIAPPITFTMMGDMLGGHSVAKRWLPLSAIDPDMARAAIAAEDSRFCSHGGFDLEAIEDAFARNQKGGRIRGGSTISQQTAKNVFLWQGGGYFRKALEAWFTLLIEHVWGKRRIMEVYLNVAETGIGTYGVEAGAQRYFGHGAGSMTAREAAQIAAVLPLPKKRAGTAPKGFTRRYASSIAARIAVVRNDRLDACFR